MALLYYWRPDNYLRDRDFGFGYHLNQNNPLLTTLQENDSLWAFTRRQRDGIYVLGCRANRSRGDPERPEVSLWAYRVWADLNQLPQLGLDSHDRS